MLLTFSLYFGLLGLAALYDVHCRFQAQQMRARGVELARRMVLPPH